MSVSPSVPLISLAIAIPLMLLALSVLYHACTLARLGLRTRSMALTSKRTWGRFRPESAEELLADLQDMITQMPLAAAAGEDRGTAGP